MDDHDMSRVHPCTSKVKWVQSIDRGQDSLKEVPIFSASVLILPTLLFSYSSLHGISDQLGKIFEVSW